MKLTKNQQINALKKLFGSKSDLIDFQSHVDGRLNYDENKRIILKKIKNRGISIKSKLTFKGSPIFYLDKAEYIHNKRSNRSKSQDSVVRAKKTFNHKRLTALQFNKWKRNPHRFDIITIDTKGTFSKPKKIKKLSIEDIDSIDIL